MLLKIIVLNILLCFNWILGTKNSQNKNDNDVYEVVKVINYKGKNLEAVYKVNYKNKLTNSVRLFEVIKTDSRFKNYFLADFLLVERKQNKPGIICYPTGWESVKSIKEKELEETCRLVVKGEIPPEEIN